MQRRTPSPSDDSAQHDYPTPPLDDMRATFRTSTPSSPARTDAATPRPDKGVRAPPPVLYESGSGLRSQALFAQPPESQSVLAAPLGIEVHDLFPPAAPSPSAFFRDDLQNDPEFVDHPDFLSAGPRDRSLYGTPPTGHAPGLGRPTIMPEQRSSASDPGKPPGSSRGRSYSNASRRGGSSTRPPSSQPYSSSVGRYPPQPDPSQARPSYLGQYQQPSNPYTQRGAYGGAPYTIAPPQALPSSMVGQQSAAPYSYASHPGLLASDPSMQPQNPLVAYSPTGMMPMMPPPHTPVYTYPAGHTSEASSSSSLPYTTTPTTTPGLYSSAPSTHTLLTNPVTSPPHTSSYTSPSPYAAPFATTSYMYPQHSFASSGSALYQGQYSYGQQYRPQMSTEQDQGTWWYLPPGTRPAPSPHYHAYENPYPPIHALYPSHETEYPPPPQSAPPAQSSMYSMSPQHRPSTQGFPGASPPQPQPQRPPGPDPPHSAGEPSQRAFSEPPRSEAPLSPTTMSRTDRKNVRKQYHPNPPASRSEWVMWAGNVPSDATHDELWRFFNRTPLPSPVSPLLSSASDAASQASAHGGVSSIHLISRSNCAFVNFETEAHLQAAIRHFNGLPLRAGDPRCPRLVCRIRAREDDLKAGVGGQRGAGLHSRYVKELRQRQARARAATMPESGSGPPSSSSPEDPSHMMAGLSLSSDEEGPHANRFKQHSNSSGSYASTNSSLLTQYFPKRYFILKSLTQFDLDLSVEKGLWATQRHNEGILDQAYRTSKDVYLIFGVNKSGEFYGYARMAGPVLKHRGEQRDEHRVSWASRSSIDSRSSVASSPQAARSTQSFLSPDSNRYEESPLPIESPDAAGRPALDHQTRTAPAVMHSQHRPLSKLSAGVPHYGGLSYHERPLPAAATIMAATDAGVQEDFELDPEAPRRAAKQRSEDTVVDEAGVKRWDASDDGRQSLAALEEVDEAQAQSPPAPPQAQVPAPPSASASAPAAAAGEPEGKDEGPVWGESFQVEWIRTTRLPFYRTRHLRNPWNHDREVKVSRDGTELEPSVGQALLDEWDKPDPGLSPTGRQATKSVPPDAVPA